MLPAYAGLVQLTSNRERRKTPLVGRGNICTHQRYLELYDLFPLIFVHYLKCLSVKKPSLEYLLIVNKVEKLIYFPCRLRTPHRKSNIRVVNCSISDKVKVNAESPLPKVSLSKKVFLVLEVVGF